MRAAAVLFINMQILISFFLVNSATNIEWLK